MSIGMKCRNCDRILLFDLDATDCCACCLAPQGDKRYEQWIKDRKDEREEEAATPAPPPPELTLVGYTLTTDISVKGEITWRHMAKIREEFPMGAEFENHTKTLRVHHRWNLITPEQVFSKVERILAGE